MRDRPDAALLCLVDPSPVAKPLAIDLGVPWYGSVQEMLQARDIPDAAIVCTPNSTHVSISIELLKAGVHVLVEKPIATTIADAHQLVDFARSSGKKLLVGHHRRFNPYITATKRALSEKAIGKVIAVSGLWTAYKPASYFEGPGAWRTKAGNGGPLLINMIHEIDLLHYLFGPITRVHAERTIPQRGHESEEGAAILLRFASGVVGTFLLSDATPSPHNFEGGTGENPMVTKTGKDFYRIFGSAGTLSVGDMQISRFTEGQPKSWSSSFEESTVAVGSEIPFDEQVSHLVRVVRGGEEPRCTGEDGLRALVVVDAIKCATVSEHAVSVRSTKL
ncbi:hypothetical protein B0A55_00114 [Friedmanniomyces simplex]|uniref:Gfo/Idh/MocA-like oxidoreductase N-terminal domain-containing protein n=1 Tax=Friedmanniomyces simplex TaxID=329884 RepID=A0A4U0Y2Z6_9PEZI|nr:hypothetical protein B0A55_00114 [Friedmanniomyces simplex]